MDEKDIEAVEKMIDRGSLKSEVVIRGERWVKADPRESADFALDAIEKIRKWKEFPHDLRYVLIERASQYFLRNVDGE